jgi:hypothetical protein
MWTNTKIKKRTALCQENLERRIHAEVKGGCIDQILWLVCHLEEYIQRWLEFARMENLTVAATLQNDVFCIVVAAANLIEDRIVSLNRGVRFPREEWGHFRNALEWILKTPDRDELILIGNTFDCFRKKIRTLDCENEAPNQ